MLVKIVSGMGSSTSAWMMRRSGSPSCFESCERRGCNWLSSRVVQAPFNTLVPPSSGRPSKVREQVEGEAQEAVAKEQPPALDGRAACSAAVGGEGATDRMAGEKEQEDDLPHLPQIPAEWRNALRQDGAGATALRAI
jgi:hypothetical protein